MLTVVLIALLTYLALGLSVYVYAVYKTWEYIGVINFAIEEKNIGLCIYPQWLLSWVYWIIKKVGL